MGSENIKYFEIKFKCSNAIYFVKEGVHSPLIGRIKSPEEREASIKDGNEAGSGRVEHLQTHPRNPPTKPAPNSNPDSGENPPPPPNLTGTRNPKGDPRPKFQQRRLQANPQELGLG